MLDFQGARRAVEQFQTRLQIAQAALPAAGDRSYTADSLGLRAQFDF